MRITFVDEGWEDYLYWVDHDPVQLKRLNKIIRDVVRSPFAGIGKPEPLRNDYKGWWSRRIDAEHRLIYRVVGQGDNQTIEIVACRFHYDSR